MHKVIIAVSSGIRIKHKYTVWAESLFFLNVKPGGTYSYQLGFKWLNTS